MLGVLLLTLFVVYILFSLREVYENTQYYFPGERVRYRRVYYGEVIEDHGSVVSIRLNAARVGITVPKVFLERYTS